ncbi:uncharacterized protein LOC135200658 [Macrobrachium nipponense]
MQNELEEVTEKLSEMVARQYLVTPRGQIIATTLLTRRRRHKFVRAVSRGLLPPETPPSLRRSRKRRLPGLMGMDPVDDELEAGHDDGDKEGSESDIVLMLLLGLQA